MNITPQQRHNPSKAEIEELLSMLLAANEQGQLVSLTFMLKDGDRAMVDYRGSMELTELACREVNGRIAQAVETHHPQLAAAIRDSLGNIAHRVN